ncbi:MAG: hypothetical protein JSU68_02160 [Phycisphaerales bacterium]|nr:MAG: hypothetical protein JSU68_02160 [Phycisphaerales bacterium]
MPSIMNSVAQRTLATTSDRSNNGAAPVAVIDLDRFCDGCGYNLRTLPVYLDDRTGIPVVRCTECGRYQAASDGATALRPWLNRLTALFLWAWVLTVFSGFVLIVLGEGALAYATLDELTVRGGATTQIINNTVIRTWQRMGPLEVDTAYRDYWLFISGIYGSSFLLAFTGGMYLMIVVPHWRRVAYTGVVLAVPLLVGLVVAFSWNEQAPHLFGWGLTYVAAHAGVQVLGGVLGVVLGRPAARMLVRLVLPASIRPRLAYLWLADNKPFPKA